MTDALRVALKARASELSQRVLDRLYGNPFWMERYGERGRRFADEDSLYHIQYLDQALAAGEARVFERYAAWLRSILVSRGMCSEHLAENFRLLDDTGAAAGLPSWDAAHTVLTRGVEALVYSEGAAAALELRRQALVTAVERTPGGSGMREDDRRYLVSYFIDAAAAHDPAIFDAFAARCSADAVAALRLAARSARPGL